jgi:hypothetical protein
MALARVLPALDGKALLAAFYCQPRQFVSTFSLKE